jgi:hypothetical protein
MPLTPAETIALLVAVRNGPVTVPEGRDEDYIEFAKWYNAQMKDSEDWFFMNDDSCERKPRHGYCIDFGSGNMPSDLEEFFLTRAQWKKRFAKDEEDEEDEDE